MSSSLRAPLVSVIMPIHGEPTWLEESLKSVLDQSFADWELIASLDGPNPKAEEILDTFGSRFRYVSGEVQRGPAAARNAAILLSRAKYLALLDSDDFWPADHLAELVGYLERCDDVVLVGCSAQKVGAHGRLLNRRITVPSWNLNKKLIVRNVIVNSSAVFRRVAASVAGGYSSGVSMMEDYHLWLRLAVLGRVANLSDRDVFYRVHAQQSSRERPSVLAIRAIGTARLKAAQVMRVSLMTVWTHHIAWALWQRMVSLKNSLGDQPRRGVRFLSDLANKP
jgi:glycosyltransferase involved in cell wall biosynthesis